MFQGILCQSLSVFEETDEDPWEQHQHRIILTGISIEIWRLGILMMEILLLHAKGFCVNLVLPLRGLKLHLYAEVKQRVKRIVHGNGAYWVVWN